MVSKTCEHAIKAMLFVAQNSKDDIKVGVKEIAKAIDAPEPFIAKILQEMGRKGIVLSAKGPAGGFYLDAKGMQQSLADIVYAVDGDKLFTGCGLGLKSCSAKRPCPIHDQFASIRTQIKELLQTTTLSDYQKTLDLGKMYLRR